MSRLRLLSAAALLAVAANASASSFIVTTDAAPWLDGKHTVFGRVTEGMDTVDTIERTPTGSGDRPVEPVVAMTSIPNRSNSARGRNASVFNAASIVSK